ncbi:MAG: hypothetical protein GY777_23245 [Candidatus Brocadiaceae bacterium]|nr:hypothetical protein [Candidatus Brocadiaceae bacterium]
MAQKIILLIKGDPDHADLIEIMNSPNPGNSKESRKFRRRSTVEVNRKH